MELLLDLVDEHLELLVVGLHEVLVGDALEVGRHRREELGAGVVKHVDELVAVASLKLEKPLGVLLLQVGVDRVVDAHRVEVERDGEQVEDLLVLFGDLKEERASVVRLTRSFDCLFMSFLFK